MISEKRPHENKIRQITTKSAILLSFIAAFEIVIMISPFAFYFYAVFNPFLLALNQSRITRWLTAFFLPHMVVPPNEVLVAIRILGSVFFVAGMAVFLGCAGQVYLGKLFRKGPATKGLYAFVRHPQYASLAVAAVGLAIMWPRFLTLVLLCVMVLLYFILAKDEERRMVNRFGESYVAYRNRTGMFLPRVIENSFMKTKSSPGPMTVLRGMLVLLALLLVTVGAGFLLREYTVHHLPLLQIGNVDVITITPDDSSTARALVPAVLEDSAVVTRLKAFQNNPGHRVLAYFIPIDYVMQGMIANTGGEWKLFEQHKTIGMISEYILHPFAHLTAGHAHHMDISKMKHGPEMYALAQMKRRVIFIDVAGEHGQPESPYDEFGINVHRIPVLYVDVHLHTAEILQVQDAPAESGWGTVPTPMF